MSKRKRQVTAQMFPAREYQIGVLRPLRAMSLAGLPLFDTPKPTAKTTHKQGDFYDLSQHDNEHPAPAAAPTGSASPTGRGATMPPVAVQANGDGAGVEGNGHHSRRH